MPVITINLEDLNRLLPQPLSPAELRETIPLLGADPDEISDHEAVIEFFPDRPDLLSTEGVARALRAFTGQAPGLVRCAVAKPKTWLSVEPSITDIRPWFLGGIVRGVTLDDVALRSLMELQEKLHVTTGRRRRKASIGIHDMAPLKPPFRFYGCSPHEPAFIPLGCDEPMTPEEILQEHPKGVAYAHIIADEERYPLIVDSQEQVLSMPPIINGQLTALSADTTDILIDVQGLDRQAVETCLNIVTAALVERGGSAEALEIRYPSEKYIVPDMAPREHRADHDYLTRLLGWDPGEEQVRRAFGRCGLEGELRDGEWIVQVPAWRADLLHPVDLLEELAIGLEYDEIPEQLPQLATFGRETASRQRERECREALLGLGFQEVVSLTLSSARAQHELPARGPAGEAHVANPVGEEYHLLRPALLPGLLELLRTNRHHELPQRVFEVGWVVRDHANRLALGWVELNSRAPFSQARAIAQAVAQRLGIDGDAQPVEDGMFISGRCASLSGALVFGEIHPRVLEGCELGYPAIGGEVLW
ncbi:MAG: phenylalanine--tRNA ligase subunit beta [Candidatus Poseidoniia archaeon]|jgi:phenylalanyl-tRNA synthetase beta chain|nr:phenylalanine--tRNA ligase subunit beta [Candidatus Poseidoniia archaeon]MDP7136030.1 phenylalanine--tRNA ligase subunit beta [Candidatus Poseidoniia archaeon]MDP7243122.1 phenylalanine--tRNA ligase subunit beta [Candidatus Poseidoniia archaeon]MDP7535536.1 phenylalanine--tRNA ligase subunit beta [Candidatus Poseidoniia archaeon]MDP7607475.1 phenylalanine--tRNA ligase subunit beta [Candidatus Poseidoniia archaeon]